MTHWQVNIAHFVYFIKIVNWKDQRRHALRWLCSLQKDYLVRKPLPWLTYDTIEYIEKYLQGRSEARVFEYGSGGSTLFWLKMGARVVSIEHDPIWFNNIRDRIGQNDHLDYRLVEPKYQGEEWAYISDPAKSYDYATTDDKLRNYSFEHYVKQVDGFSDNYFDIIIVDGRSRPACVQHSATKVSPGGLLVLDNAERSYYQPTVLNLMQCYTKQIYSGVGPSTNYPWVTEILIKHC